MGRGWDKETEMLEEWQPTEISFRTFPNEAASTADADIFGRRSTIKALAFPN